MRRWFHLSLNILMPVLAVGIGAALLLIDPPLMQTLRQAVFDQYQRVHPRVYQPAPVRIIDIDEESLAKVGQWPWPRSRIAELVERMRKAGVAAVGFDVLFAEPDRTSPKAMLNIWNLPAPARHSIAGLPDHDDLFAAALEPGGVVLGLSVEREGIGLDLPAQKYRFVNMGESALPFAHVFSRAVPSLPLLSEAAAGNGVLTFVPDNDGVVRRVPLLLRLGDTLVPSLVAEVLRVGQGAQNYVLRTSETPGVGMTEVKIGQFAVPTTAAGEAWVHFTGPVKERTIPAWKILAGEIPDADLQGTLLLVGTSAQGLMDLRFSPLGGVMPGVEAHAQLLEQVLTDSYLYRPAWANSIEAMTIVIGGLALGTLALVTGALASALVALLVIGGVIWAGWLAFIDHRLLLDPVTPALGIFIAFSLSSVMHHLSTERRQRFVREAFSRYVSPNLVSYIVEHPDQLELGGKRQECSFVFTDLAGFTSLMEKIDPGDVIALLNAYLDQMISIAFSFNGTLERIIGDAVVIMFSAPVQQSDHRQRALNCAIAMQRFASRYADDIRARGLAFGQTRIGVHSGTVIVGNFGGSHMFDYRALGDTINTASRLESVNKHLGTRMCVSENTLSGCTGVVTRPVGRLVLKGKTEPLMVYQPIHNGLDVPGASLDDPQYAAAYALLTQDPVAARVAFEQLARERPEDPLVRLHLQRLQENQTGDLIVMSDK
ncbi:adenylate/guanylate cyclase domain-containing protein [Rhodoferax sp.]|uniref:CHASE2 domain-containing protein n=1 Tax=Rhodoferax sp. TaxID=50421 RepID=UPI0025D8377A|nr:adenylate/guanylate cyclase domain-containing protein [Rhodoferax sp.]MCM2297561.1 adenylate/guanylate cyclase domain-containing protein [Rhodoferax sp.]